MTHELTHSSSKLFISTLGEHTQMGHYNTEIMVNIPPIILGQNDEHQLIIGLESLTIPLSIKMINENNNKIEIDNILYTIPSGNYTITNLVNFLNTINPSEYTFTYNQDKNRITLTLTSNPTYIIGNNTTCLKIVGCLPSIIPYQSGVLFTSIVNLTSTTSILVQIQNLYTANYDNLTKSSTTIARVPISCQPNQILSFYNNQPFYSTVSNRTIQMLHIRLLTDNYEPLILDGSVDYNMTLRLDYILKKV
jgi:hypothetical protein